MLENEKIKEVEEKIHVHGREIKFLKEFKEEHQEEHFKILFEHKINTKKLEYIEKGLFYVLSICVSILIYSIFKLIIR